MPKVAKSSRRLDPKLRTIRNGDAIVNALRSEISAAMVSTRAAEPAAPVQAAPQGDLATAQAAMHMLSPERADLPRQRLGKRQPLRKRPAADDAYVNVFIEFLHHRGAADEPGEAAAIAAVAKEIEREVPKRRLRQVKGAVLPRRNFLLATVPVAMLPTLEANPEISFIHRADPVKLDVPEARKAGRPPSRAVGRPATHGRGKEVLIGIIDVGGFDFAHPDFLDDKGRTRFVAIWDQGGDFRKPPAQFGYGAEFTGQHLDAAVRASRRKGTLPATLLEPQSQRMPGSHGTHVASIAAGNRGVCPKARIAAVLIDIPQPADTRERRRFTFSDSSRIVHAVEYLLDVAKAHKLPLSINISLGTNGGAHDGSSGVSRWLDALLSTPGRAISVAAGNAGQEKPAAEDDLGWITGRIHTSGRILSRGLDVDLEWTVIGDGIEDISENELEIWYGAQDRFIAMVKPPSSDQWIEVRPRQFVENRRLPSGTTLSVYNELYHPANGANYISVYLSPNLQPDNIRGIEAGVWKVRLRGEEIRDGRFNGWVERDDPSEIGGDGRRRLFRFPSFFSAASNIDSHSINTLACGHRVIAVANVDSKLQRINVTSSQGPTRDARCKPDIGAPGTGIVAANGFGPRGEPWIAMTGTSMASPYVAGVVGLMLAANPDLTSAQCAGILQRTARPLPGLSYEWRNDAGFGVIDPQAAVEEARTFNLREELR